MLLIIQQCAKRMSQQRVSRYGVTHATGNAVHAEWVSQ